MTRERMIERSGWNMNEQDQDAVMEAKRQAYEEENKRSTMAEKANMAKITELAQGMEKSGQLRSLPFRRNLNAKVTGRPDPIQYDWNHIMQLCIQRMHATRDSGSIVLPVSEYLNTKKNRARIDPTDSTSPTGFIDKTDNFAKLNFQPYASARFDAVEVLQWLIKSGKVVNEQGSDVP